MLHRKKLPPPQFFFLLPSLPPVLALYNAAENEAEPFTRALCFSAAEPYGEGPPLWFDGSRSRPKQARRMVIPVFLYSNIIYHRRIKMKG
jgi:hypothetical protein